jgi:hypothetical protein
MASAEKPWQKTERHVFSFLPIGYIGSIWSAYGAMRCSVHRSGACTQHRIVHTLKALRGACEVIHISADPAASAQAARDAAG